MVWLSVVSEAETVAVTEAVSDSVFVLLQAVTDNAKTAAVISNKAFMYFLLIMIVYLLSVYDRILRGNPKMHLKCV